METEDLISLFLLILKIKRWRNMGELFAFITESSINMFHVSFLLFQFWAASYTGELDMP